jgi:hypothetical protein
MPGMGRLTPGNRYYQASGEATEQAQLPTKFIARNQNTSPIVSTNNPPAGFTGFGPLALALVQRAERMIGMRYMYGLGSERMPIHPLGADGTPVPFTSAVQPMNHGPIHNGGFNDALFQAGYPGFNLGLSFKVPTLPQNQTVPTRGVQKSINITQKLIRTGRATGQPKGT